MKNYWPLVVITLILLAIIGLSQVVTSRKKQYEVSQKMVTNASISKGEEQNSASSARESYKTPVWSKYVTFPEALGVWAVVLTLIAIVWQSIETRKSADGALLSAKAAQAQLDFQKEALRPRLSIVKFTKAPFQEALKGEWVFINMEIFNSGGMPAYGVVADTWIEFVSGGSPYLLTSNARYRRSPPMSVHTGSPSGFFIPLGRKLTEEERNQMANAKGAVCFRIRMNYKAFGEEFHTDEAYIMRPDDMQAIPEYASAS